MKSCFSAGWCMKSQTSEVVCTSWREETIAVIMNGRRRPPTFSPSAGWSTTSNPPSSMSLPSLSLTMSNKHNKLNLNYFITHQRPCPSLIQSQRPYTSHSAGNTEQCFTVTVLPADIITCRSTWMKASYILNLMSTKRYNYIIITAK